MAIELEKAIELFNKALNNCPEYGDLESDIQERVRLRAIQWLFIADASRYEPKGIAGYLVQHASRFSPTIPDNLVDLNRGIGKDVGFFIYAVEAIKNEFNDLISEAYPKPKPQQQAQLRREPAREEDYVERSKTNPSKSADRLGKAGKKSGTYDEDWDGSWK